MEQIEQQIYASFESWIKDKMADLKIFFPTADERTLRTVLSSAYLEGAMTIAKLIDKKI